MFDETCEGKSITKSKHECMARWQAQDCFVFDRRFTSHVLYYKRFFGIKTLQSDEQKRQTDRIK